MPSPEAPLTGSCACGAVRFEITAPFFTAGYCHCKRCQRRSGALWALNAMVDAERVPDRRGCGRRPHLAPAGRPPEVLLRALRRARVLRRSRLGAGGRRPARRRRRRSRHPAALAPVGRVGAGLGTAPRRRPPPLRPAAPGLAVDHEELAPVAAGDTAVLRVRIERQERVARSLERPADAPQPRPCQHGVERPGGAHRHAEASAAGEPGRRSRCRPPSRRSGRRSCGSTTARAAVDEICWQRAVWRSSRPRCRTRRPSEATGGALAEHQLASAGTDRPAARPAGRGRPARRARSTKPLAIQARPRSSAASSPNAVDGEPTARGCAAPGSRTTGRAVSPVCSTAPIAAAGQPRAQQAVTGAPRDRCRRRPR